VSKTDAQLQRQTRLHKITHTTNPSKLHIPIDAEKPSNNYPSGEVNKMRIQTIVIGGGQAGLAVGYHLAKRRLPFLILDANQRIGDAWRNR